MSEEGKVREDKDDVRGRGRRNKEKQERSLLFAACQSRLLGDYIEK